MVLLPLVVTASFLFLRNPREHRTKFAENSSALAIHDEPAQPNRLSPNSRPATEKQGVLELVAVPVTSSEPPVPADSSFAPLQSDTRDMFSGTPPLPTTVESAGAAGGESSKQPGDAENGDHAPAAARQPNWVTSSDPQLPDENVAPIRSEDSSHDDPVIAQHGTQDAPVDSKPVETPELNTELLPFDNRPSDSAEIAADTTGTDAAGGPAPPTGVAHEAPLLLGTLSADSIPLVKLNPQSGEWRILPPGSELGSGDRLLSLPLSRPSIAFSNDALLEIGGNALVIWEPESSAGPVVDLVDGHAWLALPQSSSSVSIRMTQATFTFQPSDRNSVLALSSTTAGGEVVVVEGEVFCAVAGEEHSLDASQSLAVTLEGAVEVRPASGTVATWTIRTEPGLVDRMALKNVVAALSPDEDLRTSLARILKSPQPRDRYVATLGLAMMGYLEPALAALNDPKQKSLWPDAILTTRRALAAGPEAAEHVRSILEALYGKQLAEPLFELLAGYSLEELQSHAAATLVDGLDHELLAYRVLSIANLQEWTGAAAYYQPDAGPTQRRRNIYTWRQWLKDGRLLSKAMAHSGSSRTESDVITVAEFTAGDEKAR
jgi:hypothetical protein